VQSICSSDFLGADTVPPLEHTKQLLSRNAESCSTVHVEQQLYWIGYGGYNEAHRAAAFWEHREQL